MNDENKLELIEKKCLTLLQNLRNNDDAGIYTTSLIILGILVFITILALYVKNNYSNFLLFGLLITAVLFIVFKVKTNAVIKESIAKSGFLKEQAESKIQHVTNMLEYLSSGLQVKLVRIKLVRLIYFILFPVFLLLIRELFLGESTSMALFNGYLGGLGLSLVAWYYFFKTEITNLVYYKEDVDEMRTYLINQL